MSAEIVEGDVTARHRWTVYTLADPQRPRDVFYVGMSRHPSARLNAHRRADTAAGRRVREIEAQGRYVAMRRLLETDSLMRATELEIAEIQRRPGAVNLWRGPKERTESLAATLPVSLIRRLIEEKNRLGLDSKSAAVRVVLERALKKRQRPILSEARGK